MATIARTSPTPISRRARRWAKDNLFGSVGNTLLTVITAAILGFVFYQILRFVFVTAEWEVIGVNRINDTVIGSGIVGPITASIATEFRKRVSDNAPED